MKPQKLYEIFTEALADENIKAELIEIIENKFEPMHIEGQTELFPQSDISALSAENTAHCPSCAVRKRLVLFKKGYLDRI